MSNFSLKMMFPLLVVLLIFTVGGVFFAATGLVTPVADAVAAQEVEQGFYCGNNSVEDSLLIAANRPMEKPLPPGIEAANVAAGDVLFKGNCAQCHAVNDVVVGPALAGVTERRSIAWLIPWVRNSSKVVASGDEYAVKLFNQYQKQQMPSFALSDQEIQQILTYIQAVGSASNSYPVVVACN